MIIPNNSGVIAITEISLEDYATFFVFHIFFGFRIFEKASKIVTFNIKLAVDQM